MNEAIKATFNVDPHGLVCGLLLVAVVVITLLYLRERSNASRDIG